MISIDWQGQRLNVRRLVVRHNEDSYFAGSLAALARKSHVAIADDSVEPRADDFWFGCHPSQGWGDVNWHRIGWASQSEVPLALSLLISDASRYPTP